MFLRVFVSTVLRLVAVATVGHACGFMLIAQQQGSKVQAPHRPYGPKLEHRFPLPSPVSGSMVGGPWMIDGNFKSSVYIKNGVETSAITVTPVLYLSNGRAYTLPDISLEPSGTSILDIGASLEKVGIASYATLSGYIELKYTWPWDPICATIRNLDTTHSVIFNYGLRSSKAPDLPGQLTPPTTTTSRVIEGAWWKQESHVTGFVALTNTTSQSLSVKVQLSDDVGQTFGEQTAEVSPHGTKMLQLNGLATAKTAVGGVRVQYTGKATDLLINGGLEDIGVGYSAVMPFTSAPASEESSSATVVELGLMTGPADPMMHFPAGTVFSPYTVLRNVSRNAIVATPTLWWMAGGVAQSSQLPAVVLSALQSRSIDFASLLRQAGLDQFSGTFQLAFQVEGNSGGLLLAGGSVDATNTYVFEVTPHALAESASKSLSYWNIANGDDTMVTIWNPADEPQDFLFRLTFTGGYYDYAMHLEAHTSRSFNISEIVESGVPDPNGNVIPAAVDQGGAKIMGNHADNEHILVAIDAGTYNIRKATCGLYCQSCDGVTAASVADTPFVVPMTKQHQQAFYVTWNTGSQYNVTSFAKWTTSASSIATVGTPGNGISGMISGVSPGSATITAQYNASNEPNYSPYFCEGSQWSCPMSYFNGQRSSDGHVCPSINIVYPSPIVAGTNGAMGIRGSNFTGFTVSSVSLSGSGVSVSGASVASDTVINATYSATSNAQTGTKNLTVTFLKSDGWSCQSNALPVNVSASWPVPKSASIEQNLKQTYSNQPWTPCDGLKSINNAYGYQRCVVYQINDASSQPIPENFGVQEAVSQVDGNIPAPLQSGNNISNAGGQFDDEIALVSTSPLASNSCWIGKQTITATGNSSPIRVNCIRYSSSDVTITDVTSNPSSCSITTYHC